jgi:hypothetical protein
MPFSSSLHTTNDISPWLNFLNDLILKKRQKTNIKSHALGNPPIFNGA